MWVTGLDPFCPWEGNEDDIQQNTGKGERNPLGPECEVNGGKITTFCYCTENGSFTPELLKEMLKNINKHEEFNQSDGISPFLLLDGHGSWFQLEFLEYVNDVNNKGHK